MWITLRTAVIQENLNVRLYPKNLIDGDVLILYKEIYILSFSSSFKLMTK